MLLSVNHIAYASNQANVAPKLATVNLHQVIMYTYIKAYT